MDHINLAAALLGAVEQLPGVASASIIEQAPWVIGVTTDEDAELFVEVKLA